MTVAGGIWMAGVGVVAVVAAGADIVVDGDGLVETSRGGHHFVILKSYLLGLNMVLVEGLLLPESLRDFRRFEKTDPESGSGSPPVC